MAATTFDVLAEPARRRILDLLLERPCSVGELVERIGLSQPGTSKHLRVLREAGLVDVRKDAQRRLYELRPEPLAPEAPVRLEPRVELGDRLRVERIDAPLGIALHPHESGLAQHAQVLRRAGLAQSEPLDDLPDWPRPVE